MLVQDSENTLSQEVWLLELQQRYRAVDMTSPLDMLYYKMYTPFQINFDCNLAIFSLGFGYTGSCFCGFPQSLQAMTASFHICTYSLFMITFQCHLMLITGCWNSVIKQRNQSQLLSLYISVQRNIFL